MMIKKYTLFGVICVATGCAGEGSWVVTIWGEEFIEQGIPAEVFADGCTVVYDEFLVVQRDRALLDGDDAVVGSLEGAQVYDLTQEGPIEMGRTLVPATHYALATVTIGPANGLTAGNANAEQVAELEAAQASIIAGGNLSCDDSSVYFRWIFSTETQYRCEPEDLTIPASGEDTTQITVHGDHLFYDGLENPEAQVKGLAILQADANGDGTVTLAELDAVSVASLGYDVGRYSEVTHLGEFVTFLTRTLGHVDGEGHCQVAF